MELLLSVLVVAGIVLGALGMLVLIVGGIAASAMDADSIGPDASVPAGRLAGPAPTRHTPAAAITSLGGPASRGRVVAAGAVSAVHTLPAGAH